MSTDLYKVSNKVWAIKSHKIKEDGGVCAFDTIEEAATLLEEIGIKSDEIDMAIIELSVKGHTHAQFGVLEGRFMFSDNEAPLFTVGTA